MVTAARSKRVQAIIVLTVLTVLAVALGLSRTVLLVFVVVIFGLAYAYPLYLLVMWAPTARRTVSVEGSTLVERVRHGSQLRSVDLGRPFDASCEFHDMTRALYVVRQGRTRMRFMVPLASDGGIVKQALGLEWPPPPRPPWWV